MAQIRRLFGELWKRLQVDRPPYNLVLDDSGIVPVVILDDATDDEWEDLFVKYETSKTASQVWYQSHTLATGYEYRISLITVEVYGFSDVADSLTMRLLYCPSSAIASGAMLAGNIQRTAFTTDQISAGRYVWQYPNNQTNVLNGRDVSFRVQENLGATFAIDWQYTCTANVGTRELRAIIVVQRRRLYGKLD